MSCGPGAVGRSRGGAVSPPASTESSPRSRSTGEPLPTGDALRAHWLDRLPEGERRLLQVVVEAYPGAVEREAISEAAGYRKSTRDLYLQRLAARRLVVAEGRGAVRAAAELFG